MIKIKLKPIVMALTTVTVCLSSSNVFAGGPVNKVAINEFYRSGNLTTTNEWAEIILLENLTAVELNTYFVGDSTGSTASKFSSYQFTNMENIASTFCAGTIITVGGTTGPASDTAYAPGSNDWNLSLQTAGTNITSTTGGGNFASDDVVYIDTTDTGNTLSADGFAINWDDTPGTFGSNATFNLSTGSNEPNNDTGAFLNDVLANSAIEASWVSDTILGSLTPGAANGGNNSTSIQALQASALGTVTIGDTPTNNEGNVGTTAFTFTVTRSASCAAASVDYAVTGTGANPADAADFGGALPSGTANFAAGVTTATVTINVTGDTDVEMDETFLVTISNPIGVALDPVTTDTGTITNDDVAVAANISIDNVTQNEGNAGTSTFDFTVSIDAAADATVQVDTADGSATAGSDYTAIAAQTVTFTAMGPLTQTVSVTVNGDTTIETDETFTVNLSNAMGATITDAQGDGSITNDDAAVISIDDVTQAEGDVGSSTFDFTVSIDNSTDATVQVNTSNGTATTADSDYDAIAGQMVTFTAGGATTQSVSVTVNGDVAVESNETFNVDLSNVTGASVSIGDNQGIGTINNDDNVQAVLSAIKSVSGNFIPTGLVTYTIVINNTGPNPQNDNPGDEMTDVLPASMNFVSGSASNGTVTNIGNTVSWNGIVAAGGSTTVTINAQLNGNAFGLIENQALVNYDNTGDGNNDSNVMSNNPVGVGPTTFFVMVMVPTLSTYGLLLLTLLMIALVYRRKTFSK